MGAAVTADVQHSEVQLHAASPGDWAESHNILASGSGLRIGNLPEDAVLVSRSIPVPIASPAPFLAVTAVWTVESTQQAEAAIDVRASQDGATWSEWERVAVGGDLSTDSPALFGGLRYFPKETTRVQFRVTLPRGVGAVSTLTSFRAIFISPGETSPSPAEQSIGSPSGEAVSKPSVVTRVGWGCPDGQSSPEWPPQYTTVNFLIVHHTDDSNNHTDWAAVVRSIFTLHKVTRGWGDIGYNYLVDPNGVIYEGRAGGDNVIGAHFSCANSNTMGVAFLGTYSSVQPTQPAVTSVTNLLAWKAAQRGIDPFASAYHPSTQLTIHTISGHRDANGTPSSTACDKGTVCPGDVLYSMLPALRSAVSSVINPQTGTVPTVTANAATNVTSSSATLNATVTNDGGSAIVDRRFEWGIAPAWSNATNLNGGTIIVSGNNFSYTLTGLQPNTTYQFRAWAKNSVDWSMSAPLTFTTGSAATTCTFSLASTSASPSGDAGSSTISVTGSPSGCTGSWSASASSTGSWLTLTGNTSGSGSGTTQAGYSYTKNPSTTSTRTGTVTFTGQFSTSKTFTVTQAASAAPACSYSLDKTTGSGAGSGGSGSVQVTGSPSGCTGSWSAAASSSGNWLSLTGTASGSGAGSWPVSYSFGTNPSTTSARTATINFSGSFAATFTVTQAASTAPACSYSLDKTTGSGAGSGGSGSVQVTGSPSGCTGSWSAAASSSGNWLSLTSSTSGSGSGAWQVGYSFGSNPNTTTRAGTITFSGSLSATFALTQSGASGGGGSGELIADGGFEDATATGNAAPGWDVYPSPGSGHLLIVKNGSSPHIGSNYAVLGGSNGTKFDQLQQMMTIPDTGTANLTLWVKVMTYETPGDPAFDFFSVVLYDASGNFITTLRQVTNRDASDGYFKLGPFDLSAYKGTSILLGLLADNDSIFPTSFYVDDVSVQATPPVTDTLPAAPSGMTSAALSSTSIKVSWTDNSSNETGFIVYRWNGSAWAQIATLGAGATTYTNSGLQPATTYSHLVCAQNSAGSNCPGSSSSATTFPAAPAAPSGMSATVLSSTSIKVSWIDNASNETGFIVYRSNGLTWTQVATVGANVTSYTDSGLQPLTNYHHIACAQNSGGTMCPDTASSATTFPAAPAAPTGMSAAALSSTSIKISWTDNSATENGFVVYRWTGSAWGQIATVGPNVTSYTDSGLQPSTTYTYIACAQNTGGMMCPASAASATTTAAAPAAPTGMSATALSSSSIKVTWTDNATNETGFLVYRWNGAAWSQIATVGANVTSYTDSGLQPSTTYSYVACAQNAGGTMCPASAGSATTSAAVQLLPAAPGGMSAVALSSSSIQVSWLDNSTNETGFVVYRWNGVAWIQIATVGANVTSYIDTGLQPATTYLHVACAQNGAGMMCPGTASSATTNLGADILPAPPSGMSATALSSSSIRVSWTDNSNNETLFIIYRWNGATWVQVGFAGANATSYTDTGLQPATTYFHIACAQNGAGTMCPALYSSATTTR